MRRPRLMVRDLVWLVLVVALALGWGMERRRADRSAREAALARINAELMMQELRMKHLELEVIRRRDAVAESEGPVAPSR